MRILSIYSGHNAAICILDDGVVRINWELERFSRIKHDYGFSEPFLRETLRVAGLELRDIDVVAINRGLPDDSVVRLGTALRPSEVPPTTQRDVVPFVVNLLGHEFEALAVNHHLAHAACAFFTSPFEEAAIFTYDGYGDAENSSMSLGQGNSIVEFERTNFADVAGWWVSLTLNNYRMPRLHERDPGSHVGKIMALAAYGQPDAGIARQLDRDMRACRRSPSYPDPTAYAFNAAEDLSDTRSARSQSLAYAIQTKTESDVTYHFRRVHDRYRAQRNLCYAGGIALNCIANTKALAESGFQRLYVPPCPNDAGLALGMALYAYHHHLGQPRRIDHFVPYTGPDYGDTAATFEVLARRDSLAFERATNGALVDVLSRREVVCFYGARAECGPRALGNRSILCMPDRPNARDFLNEEVKSREWYRPYAPVVLAEASADVLENCPADSAYMTTAARIRPSWRERLQAVNHVDDSTRPQVLERAHNPFLHGVLRDVERRTGIPALLNTSFNLKEPIVETPDQAWATFLAMPVSFMATERCIVRKL